MKQNYLLTIVFIVFIAAKATSQISPNHYLVNFKDKAGSTYSIGKPKEFLSQRAIDRRIKYKIPYDERDIPVNKNYIDGLKALGLKVVNVSKWTNSVSVYTTDSLLIDTLPEKLSYVKSVGYHKPGNRKNIKSFTPKSTINHFGVQSVDTVIAAKYGQSFGQISMHNGQLLHQEGYQGQGIHIAILDGGFYKVNELPAFDSIRINKQILGTRDFVDGDDQVYDASEHGMMVLSTMAGNIPGKLIGTAPKAKYWLIRSEQTASEYMIEEHNWVTAAEFADSVGVDLINTSLGYTVFDDTLNNHSYKDLNGNTNLVTIGADIAASKGILVVCSAGNEGFGSWQYIGSPADADSVLSIGAIMPNKGLAFFSSKGPTYDSRIKPDVCAIGLSPVVSGTGGNTTYSSGTSFSSPIMAGLVACLWQAHPSLNNMEIIDIVKRSSDRYSLPDTSFGYGIPDIYAAHIYLNTSGFIEKPGNDKMNVFPNPFREEFYVEFISQLINVPYDLHLQLYNIQGKLLENKIFPGLRNNYSLSFFNDVGDMANGIYILKLTANDINLQKRVVKQ